MNEMKGRQWAEKVLAAPEGRHNPAEIAAAEVVVKHTPPLSMDYVEWDDEKHRLAGATTSTGQEVVMMWYDAKHTDHIISARDEWRREQLTPNGKRYELREVTDEDEHPEVLTTVEDYKNAPLHTIVARPYHAPEIKTSWDSWVSVETGKHTNSEMAHVPREVLRYGSGESME